MNEPRQVNVAGDRPNAIGWRSGARSGNGQLMMVLSLLKAVVLATIAGIGVTTGARASLLDFQVTGAGVGSGLEWQSAASIQTFENHWTAGQGDWLFTSLTKNMPGVANLLTSGVAGTGFGILLGTNYLVFDDTGTAIFTYAGELSQFDRPYNATFSPGTWTLASQDGADRLVVTTVPEPSGWTLTLTMLAIVGVARVLTSRNLVAIAA